MATLRPSARAGRRAAIALGVAGASGAALALIGIGSAFRASREERRRAMPGDGLVPDPMYSTTQAATIDVPPERVWPWLAQMGAGRGGWYSYDRIDNGGRPSAGEILRDYQHVAAGGVFPATPAVTDAFVVAAAEPARDLVLTVPSTSGPLVSWEFLLEPLDHRRTRLIVRSRVSAQWRRRAAAASSATSDPPIFIERVYAVLGRLPRPLLLATGGLGHRVMQNQQLRGLKRRAEAVEVGSSPTP
jgi:hypothetical protein